MAPLASTADRDFATQKFWTTAARSSFLDKWEAGAPGRLQALRCACSDTCDPLPKSVDPEMGLRSSHVQWQLYLRFRLGLPLSSDPTPMCAGCGVAMDPMGDHAVCCNRLGSVARHMCLRNTLTTALREASLEAHLEVPTSRRTLRSACRRFS